MVDWMLMADDLRQRLHERRHFVPFTIHVADGRKFHIPTAAHAHVQPKGVRVSIWTTDNHQHTLPTQQISEVVTDPLESFDLMD